jgi:hypothetical protein
MKIALYGLKAWIFLLITIIIAISILVILFHLIIFLIPFFIVIAILIWVANLFNKKKKKSYVDIDFKIK